MTNHTAGPWETSPDAVPESHVQVTVYAEGSGERVATVFLDHANARLIAAAPDLLAYGMEALRVLEAAGVGRNFEAIGLREAIYKATESTS